MQADVHQKESYSSMMLLIYKYILAQDLQQVAECHLK